MAQQKSPSRGTEVTAPIINKAGPSHYAGMGAGGHAEVSSLEQLYLIPVSDPPQLDYDGLGSGQRRLSMTRTVAAGEPETWLTYRLEVAGYAQLSPGAQLLALADNTNWVPYAGGGPAPAPGAGAKRVSKPFDYAAEYDLEHGLGYPPAAEVYDSDNEWRQVPTKIIDANTLRFYFDPPTAGKITYYSTTISE